MTKIFSLSPSRVDANEKKTAENLLIRIMKLTTISKTPRKKIFIVIRMRRKNFLLKVF